MEQKHPSIPADAGEDYPRPLAEIDQEYQYLYREISEEERAEMKGLSLADRAHALMDITRDWQTHRAKLQRLCEEGKAARKEKTEGAFEALRKALPAALSCVQHSAYLQMTQGQKPSLDEFLGCLSPLAQSIEEAGNKAEEAITSKDFRDFVSAGESLRVTQQASLVKFFLYPAAVIAVWFGLCQLFSAPFMADVLAHTIWEQLSYVVMLIVCLVVCLILIVSGLGLILGFVVGIFATALVGFAGMKLFELILKLAPAVAANFEAGNEWALLFFFPLWLILLLVSAFFLLHSICVHSGAFGKAARVQKAQSALREALPKVVQERQLYGLLLEMADYCEAAIRWEEGRKEKLRYFTPEQANAVTDGVRQGLQPICRNFDGTLKLLDAPEPRA